MLDPFKHLTIFQDNVFCIELKPCFKMRNTIFTTKNKRHAFRLAIQKMDLLRAFYLLASSSRNFASISLLGGYDGKLEGSQANGFVVKNCQTGEYLIVNEENSCYYFIM